MPFWTLSSSRHGAIIGERTLSYRELRDRAGAYAELLGRRSSKRLGFVLCDNSPGAVVAYLAALQIEDAVCLLAASLEPALLSRLIAAYRPEWLVAPDAQSLTVDYARSKGALGMTVYTAAESSEFPAIHPDLALLLSTSGTTGSAKMVRLSYRALAANAAAIAQYLELSSSARPITVLPIQYSYGLSVVNSHLHAEASLVLNSAPVTTRAFWDTAKAQQATSMAGVPYSYESLQRMDLNALAPTSMKVFTQAGGRLRPQLVSHFADLASARAGQFFVMYGQTEATARISYVPPSRLSDKLESIGIAIPGGELDVSPAGELVYRGANVMLGYADARSDLALGDTLQGVLNTGDLAKRDADGFYYLTGRMKRFSKLLGLRINLDDVDALLAAELACAAACTGSDTALDIAVEDHTQLARARDVVVRTYRLHASVVKVSHVAALPRTPHGKVDYAALEALVAR